MAAPAEPRLVSARDILDGVLDDCDVLYLPGGDMYVYSRGADGYSKGYDKIRDFVYNGGGLIGMAEGGAFSSKRIFCRELRIPMNSLGLMPFIASAPADAIAPPPYSLYGYRFGDGSFPRPIADLATGKRQPYIRVEDSVHPVTRGILGLHMSITGGQFAFFPAPGTDPGAVVLGRYDNSGYPAILAGSHGRGKVLIIGARPDAASARGRHDDNPPSTQGAESSEWRLLRNAAAWAIDSRRLYAIRTRRLADWWGARPELLGALGLAAYLAIATAYCIIQLRRRRSAE